MTVSEAGVVVPNGRLVYGIEGEGPLVVLLHGGALDRHMWDPQVDALSRHATVVRPDLRGHGASTTATTPFRHGDDVAVLIEALDRGPAAIVGLSLGAGAATDVALEHPDLVERVVLSGAGAADDTFEDPWLLELVARWARAQEAGDLDAWIDVFVEIAAGPHRTPAALAPDVESYLRTTAARTVADHVGPSTVLPEPVAGAVDRLGEIRVPVRSIDGALDGADHLAMPRRVTAAVADGRSTTIPDCGHYPNLEAPASFNDTLLRFGLGLVA